MKIDYRIAEVIPILMLVLSVAVLVNGYAQTGEWFQRDIDLKGGTTITVNSGPVDVGAIETALSSKFDSVTVRELRGFTGTGISVEFGSETNSTLVLQELESIGIDTSGSSVAFVSASLGEAFWTQAQIAIILAFILMGAVVFVLFRTFVPSMAVILSAAADILVTLAVMQVLGIKVSMAGLAAILMLIGYSVDTDILLNTRLLRTGEGNSNTKIKSAFWTGMAMTMTTLSALVAIVVASISPVLSQIASILIIGLVVDVISTWIQNVVIMKSYYDRRRSR